MSDKFEQKLFGVIEALKNLPKGSFFSDQINRASKGLLEIETAFGVPLNVWVSEDGTLRFSFENLRPLVHSSHYFSLDNLLPEFDNFMTSVLIRRGFDTSSEFYSLIPDIFGGDRTLEISEKIGNKLQHERYVYAGLVAGEWLDRLSDIITENGDYINIYDVAGFPIVIDLDKESTRKIILTGTSQNLLIYYAEDNKDFVILYKGISDSQPEFVLERVRNLLNEHKTKPSPTP